MSTPTDFAPTASIQNLQRRAAVLQQLRDFFTSRGFWEAQTPILSHDSCIDVWLDPFSVPLGTSRVGYLQTSPEFALKRLLCAGADKVFEVARVFRQDEIGARHNPEFTMIEWYECGVDHMAQMNLVEELVRKIGNFAVQQGWIHSDAPLVTLPTSFSRLTYREAFRQFAGVDVAKASAAELVDVARSRHLSLPTGIEHDHEGLLNLLLAELIEPELSALHAVFLYDFPASQAALARIRQDAFPVAERFELYLAGAEICNGYHELTDASELYVRMQRQNELRQQVGKPPLPPESRLLQAMQAGLPECSGVALGFDRLLTWALNLPSIRDVIAFPFDRA